MAIVVPNTGTARPSQVQPAKRLLGISAQESPLFDAERVFVAQRRLKQRLLESNVLSWRPARDLPAHMLLCIDEPQSCWQIALEWLLDELDVERVDGGWAQPTDNVYQAAQFEVIRDAALPTLAALAVNGRDRTLQLLWNTRTPLIQEDMTSKSLFDDEVRRYFLSQGVYTKMTASIVHGGRHVGLVCVDKATRLRRWNQWQYDCFSGVVNEVMAPILGEVDRIRQVSCTRLSTISTADIGLRYSLTPREAEICKLVALGWSYKEIARKIGRSNSTVDHHLRNVRQKVGVSSTARLVTFLLSDGVRASPT